MLWKGVWLFRKGVWDYLWGMTSLKYLEGADYEINASVSYSELTLMGILWRGGQLFEIWRPGRGLPEFFGVINP